jgi:hypothetical protein
MIILLIIAELSLNGMISSQHERRVMILFIPRAPDKSGIGARSLRGQRLSDLYEDCSEVIPSKLEE